MPLTVNGRSVDDSIVEAEFAQIKAYHESLGNVSCCERDGEFRGYAKENIVARMLLAEEAERRIEPPAEEEIEAEVQRIRTEHGPGQFDAMIKSAPEQLETLRRDVSLHLRVKKLLEELDHQGPPPGEEDLRRYYQGHPELFMTEEQVRASHISKAPGRGDARYDTYKIMREVREKLLDGADFDEMAREHSDKGHELIDLGFFKRGDLPEEFEMLTFSMRVGELSPVFPSTYGYHIAKVTDHKMPELKPFDEVRDEVRQKLMEERRQEQTKELVKHLQATAKIEDDSEATEEMPVGHVHSAT
jgi:parvulin-like peptidyl-prolyl isomerase